jgi:hypothetical protein
MEIPDEIAEIALKDQYFDLKGLSKYSSLGVTLLRYHIKVNGLPKFNVRNAKGKVGKVLVKRSEFDKWMERRWRQDLDAIADEVVESVKSDTQTEGQRR